MSAYDQKTVRLGRGLAALIGDNLSQSEGQTSGPSPNNIAISDIAPNPMNPRSSFDQAALDELSSSIKAQGVIQPIVVRPAPPESSAIYEIIAGERRWRASQLAGLVEVPAIVVELSDDTALEIAVIENVQREDLNPVEEARAYDTLIKRNNYTQDDVARTVGKSRSHIANLLRLLSLPMNILRQLERGEMSVGQARPLIGREDAEHLAQDIITQQLNARDVEKLVKKQGQDHKTSGDDLSSVQIDANDQARKLSEILGVPVRIAHNKKGKGRITLDYINLAQLEGITAKLKA